MGDLRRPADARGQLLVVTAFALAVLLVLMALALNTAAFGEVHVAASDDGASAERAATEYREGVRRGVGGLVTGVNGEYEEYDALGAGLEDAVAGWNGSTGRLYARDGAATDARVTDYRFESVVVQDNDTAFTDREDDTAWTVAENTSNVTGYELTVSRDALVETSGCSTGTGCFTLSVDGGGWQLSVYAPPTGGITVVVDSSAGTDQCSTANTTATVEVTNGTLEGVSCTFPTFRGDPAVDAPYTLEYANGDNASGTYRLTAAGRLTNGSIADDDRYATTGSPRIDPRIAATNVSVRYRSRTLEYRTGLHVRRGENDG